MSLGVRTSLGVWHGHPLEPGGSQRGGLGRNNNLSFSSVYLQLDIIRKIKHWFPHKAVGQLVCVGAGS